MKTAKIWCMEILCCLSKNILYTKMLRIHLFSIFTFKMSQILTGPLDTDKCTLNYIAYIDRYLL